MKPILKLRNKMGSIAAIIACRRFLTSFKCLTTISRMSAFSKRAYLNGCEENKFSISVKLRAETSVCLWLGAIKFAINETSPRKSISAPARLFTTVFNNEFRVRNGFVDKFYFNIRWSLIKFAKLTASFTANWRFMLGGRVRISLENQKVSS